MNSTDIETLKQDLEYIRNSLHKLSQKEYIEREDVDVKRLLISHLIGKIRRWQRKSDEVTR
ncbi:hypothetical protein CMI37_14600 [Candidatus Pacearchaeota archaeon]|nr:hypothetical protein [Candidatus Pacearchaeota archaeon]|tara:strand:+ start:7001 stop:7183 length:183 start_codon:yes stop_codon:yes gene_type:complete